MILVDIKWDSGLYDYNEKENELTKVLELYSADDEGKEYVYYHRVPYTYIKEHYKIAGQEDIERWKYKYFNDDGSLVFN